MKLSKLSVAMLTALNASAVLAETSDKTLLNAIYISDQAIVADDLQTPYSTRTYTRNEIQASGATSISEFLNQNTTVSVQSNGNPLSPLLDMNGYGIESGHENIQIVVDGITLNNIDLATPQLSSIALNSVEEITLIKGTGSVLYGNGTGAGAIVITTNRGVQSDDIADISTSYGSNATSHQTLNVKKTADVEGVRLLGTLNAEALHSNGAKKINADGTRNTVDNTQLSATVGLAKGSSSAILTLEKNDSEVHYAEAMPLADFREDPSANLTGGNTQQNDETIRKKLTLATELAAHTRLTYTLSQQDKSSDSVWNGDWGPVEFGFDTTQTQHKLDLKTQWERMVLQYGLSQQEAERKGSDNTTSRDDTSLYALATLNATEALTLSAGYRVQNFDYRFQNADQDLKQNDDLYAYNLGLNYLLNAKASVYANVNHAFLAPNIDRFFTFNFTTGAYEFNQFIKPQQTQTYTLGYKRQDNGLSLNAELFYVDLNDEIYYDPVTYKNTNLDESHKQGLNLAVEQNWQHFSAGLDYSYVDAVIDQHSNGGYRSNALPGTAEHTLKLFGQYEFTASWWTALPEQRLRITHKQSSDSYAISDFSNEFGRYTGYRSTDLSYQLANKQLAIQIGVNNVFDESNGLYVVKWDNTINVHPSVYERYYYVSARYQF